MGPLIWVFFTEIDGISLWSFSELSSVSFSRVIERPFALRISCFASFDDNGLAEVSKGAPCLFEEKLNDCGRTKLFLVAGRRIPRGGED